MPSNEGRAQQRTLWRADTEAESLVQEGTSVARVDSALGSLSRWNSYRDGMAILSHGYVNVLLVFVPAGIVSGALGLPAQVVFWLNFIAVIPLAPLITLAVLRLSADAGPVRGGLLRAVFGNTVEMIICILAMVEGHIQLVKWIIVGSILSYSLLLLGCGVLVTSYDKDKIEFGRTQVSILCSLMMVVAISLLIPTVMSAATPPQHDDTGNILKLSRATAIILYMLFVSYLLFRFRTHDVVFHGAAYNGVAANRNHSVIGDRLGLVSNAWILRLIFISASLCVIACGHYTIHSFDISTKKMRITKSFVGMIVLPLMGNLAKSIAIVTACRTAKIEIAIRAIMSNVLDTLLFIAPSLVLLGWIINRPMELELGFFEALVFLLAMIIMTFLLQHGKVTYFEGAMLIGTYFVIAVTFYVRPETPQTGYSSDANGSLVMLSAKTNQTAV